MDDAPIRVLIADDHQLLAEGLAQNLSSVSHIAVVGMVSNGREVLAFVNDHDVDVVLMDIDMPVLNGFEATEKITKSGLATKVIALSMHVNTNYAKKMLKLGAEGYLLKDARLETIVEAIETVQAGDKFLDSAIAKRMILSNPKETQGWIPSLTEREREILKLIAEEKTNQEIANELFISLSTVEFHRKNLLNKFNAKNSIGLVHAALRFDLI